MRQIVDIALKAISPAVNDPTTALNCIDHLGEILVSSITKTARNSDCCYAGSDLIDLLEFACYAWSNAEPIDSPAG